MTARLAAMTDPDLAGAVLGEDPACLLDPELHDGPTDRAREPALDRAAREAVAKEVCAVCPARLACLAYALRTRPTAGVWAGFTAEQITSLAAGCASAAAVLDEVAA
jgi:WhiB family redox-sensing transcriptional regulator